MGMYTRLTIWPEIERESAAVPVLQYLTDARVETPPPAEATGHPLFDTPRWKWLLTCSSYYHQTQGSRFVFDDIAKAWWLNVDSSLKDYNDEIALFLDWLAPHLTRHQSREFIGFHQYEEREHPTLLYYRDGKIVEHEVAA